MAAAAIVGSVVGGYTTWHIGRKGGEAALHRWVSPRILSRIIKWVELHPILSVFLPCVLPPPIPLSPFILASGALGMPFKRFIAIYAAARTLRYGLVAWLAVLYGRRVVRIWSKELDKWSTPLLVTFLTLMVVGIAIGIWQFRSRRGSAATSSSTIAA
jgi:membrane protein DedA with SNARE-associated domain